MTSDGAQSARGLAQSKTLRDETLLRVQDKIVTLL
jgi:hypothetical protein